MLYALTGLKKSYGNRIVLDIPDLQIAKGSIYGLLGPNGAGKTTLLNVLAFLELPTSGRILFSDEPVKPVESYLQQLRKKVILVDQQPILFTTTVYKNLEFGLKIRKVPKQERRGIILEALELVGMEDYAYAPAWTLSGGETQRVALARAIVVRPEILLCDEPTASVDAENQVTIIRILKRINKHARLTVLFTTHDRLQAVSLADRLLHLDHGRLTDVPSENIYSVTCRPKDKAHLTCGIQDLLCLTVPSKTQNAAPDKFRLMIHPEKLAIEDADGGPQPDPADTQLLPGRVIQMSAEKGSMRIIVDVGVPVTLLTDADRLPAAAQVGRQVAVRIPDDALQILPED